MRGIRLFVLAGLAVGALPSVSWAVPTQIERYTYTYVTPSGADFAGSSFVYNNTINLDTAPGSLSQTLNFQAVATGAVIYGQGATTVSPTTAPDHTPSTVLTVTSPGGTGQGFGFDYNGVASGVAGNSFLTFGTLGGRYALTFSGGGTNFVDAGGRFVSTAFIAGDYSGASSHTAATFSPGYMLNDDFIYDPIAKRTEVQVETDSYVIGVNPSLSFSLLGSPIAVPEPASLGWLAIGLAGLLARRGRRG